MESLESYEPEVIDSDKLKSDDEDNKPDDLSTVFMDCFTVMNFKLLFFIFITFILITSDVFVDKILSKFDGASENRNPTTKGSFIQGFVLVLFYIMFDVIIKLGYI